MPLLRVDKMGNLYEADPASHDGSGYKGRVPKSGGGDVNYDRSSQNSSLRYDSQMRGMGERQSIYDETEKKNANLERRKKEYQKRLAEAKQAIEGHPDYQNALLKIGLAQSKLPTAGVNIGLSGNGYTANGMSGAMGESPESLAAQLSTGQVTNPSITVSIDATRSRGQEVIHGVDPSELRQYQINRQLAQSQYNDAIRESRRVNMEAGLNTVINKNLRRDETPLAMDQDLDDVNDGSSEIRSGIPAYAGDASAPEKENPVGVAIMHPMALFFMRR